MGRRLLLLRRLAHQARMETRRLWFAAGHSCGLPQKVSATDCAVSVEKYPRLRFVRVTLLS
jgi:hypothetical protein